MEVIDRRTTSLFMLLSLPELFPTHVLKLLQTVRDLCPDLLSPTGLPSGLHPRLTHPEEADAALSLSVITAVPLFVCRKYFFSLFLSSSSPEPPV